MRPILKPISVEGDPCDSKCHVAIVDEDKNSVLAVATKNYKLILHSEVIDTLESVFKKTATLSSFELNREYFGNDGARMFRLYIFPDIEYRISDKDAVYLALLVRNSYDLSYGIGVDLMGYREICLNDLPTAASIYRLNAKHTTGLRVSVIEKHVLGAVDAFSRECKRWSEWRKFHIDSKVVIKKVVDKVLPSKSLRSYTYDKLRKFDFEKERFTKWSLFMLLTNAITHNLDLQKAKNLHKRLLGEMFRGGILSYGS